MSWGMSKSGEGAGRLPERPLAGIIRNRFLGNARELALFVCNLLSAGGLAIFHFHVTGAGATIYVGRSGFNQAPKSVVLRNGSVPRSYSGAVGRLVSSGQPPARSPVFHGRLREYRIGPNARNSRGFAVEGTIVFDDFVPRLTHTGPDVRCEHAPMSHSMPLNPAWENRCASSPAHKMISCYRRDCGGMAWPSWWCVILKNR